MFILLLDPFLPCKLIPRIFHKKKSCAMKYDILIIMLINKVFINYIYTKTFHNTFYASEYIKLPSKNGIGPDNK